MLQETLRVVSCKRCGRGIVYIRTKAGRFMPCDATPVRIIEAATGEHKALRRDTGELVSCIIAAHDSKVWDGWGYIPHFGTCSAGPQKPRKKTAPPARKPEPKKEPKKEEPETGGFEQISLFPPLERRSRHPI